MRREVTPDPVPPPKEWKEALEPRALVNQLPNSSSARSTTSIPVDIMICTHHCCGPESVGLQAPVIILVLRIRIRGLSDPWIGDG